MWSKPVEVYLCPDCGAAVEPVRFTLMGHEKQVSGTCPCQEMKWQAEREEDERKERARRVARLFDNSRLGLRFQASTFESWKPQVGTQTALDEAIAIVDEWSSRRLDGQGLLIYGPPGNGKSHLAAAIINALFTKGVAGVFQNVPELLDRIRSTYDSSVNETEAELFGALEQAELLVLDDLGAEKWSEWVETRIYRIIDARYRQRRPLIVTTNVDLKRLPEVVGGRSMDRLLEMCILVENQGRSYRRLIATQRLKARGETA